MPLRGRKRKGYPRKEEGAEEAEDGGGGAAGEGRKCSEGDGGYDFCSGAVPRPWPALSDHIHGQLQVELLFAYVNSDPRATVRAVALQCLSKLASRAVKSRVSSMWNYSVLLSVISDNVAAPALRVLAFEVLHKLSAISFHVVWLQCLSSQREVTVQMLGNPHLIGSLLRRSLKEKKLMLQAYTSPMGIEVIVTSLQELDCCSAMNLR